MIPDFTTVIKHKKYVIALVQSRNKVVHMEHILISILRTTV